MNMRNLGLRTMLACVALGSETAAATNTLLFVVDGDVSPKHPYTTVEVQAAFDPDQYAFFQSTFDVFTPPDPGRFVSQEGLLTDWPPLLGEIAPDGDSVTGIRILQIHFPVGGVFADTSNPIALWRAVWATDDFTPRDIDLTGLAHDFQLYINPAGDSQDFIDAFTPGQGVIHVIPAPTGIGFVALCALCAGVRRRR